MAVAAVGMHFDYFVGIVRQVSSGVVLMRVVAEMLGGFLAFVLAIRSSRGPGELERQQREQEDEQQFFHGLNNSIEYGCFSYLCLAATIAQPTCGNAENQR